MYNRIWTITTPPNINEKDDNGDIAFILKPERERWRKKMYNVRIYINKKRGAKIPYRAGAGAAQRISKEEGRRRRESSPNNNNN